MAMAQLVNVMKFANFVSFFVRQGDEEVSVQYSAQQVWEDTDGVWHVARNATPIHIARKAATHEEPRLSGEFDDALTDVLIGADALAEASAGRL
jgi:hypothetical protein